MILRPYLKSLVFLFSWRPDGFLGFFLRGTLLLHLLEAFLSARYRELLVVQEMLDFQQKFQVLFVIKALSCSGAGRFEDFKFRLPIPENIRFYVQDFAH